MVSDKGNLRICALICAHLREPYADEYGEASSLRIFGPGENVLVLTKQPHIKNISSD